jgi:hypothetical protein
LFSVVVEAPKRPVLAGLASFSFYLSSGFGYANIDPVYPVELAPKAGFALLLLLPNNPPLFPLAELFPNIGLGYSFFFTSSSFLVSAGLP